jgi:hypothetical protein
VLNICWKYFEWYFLVEARRDCFCKNFISNKNSDFFSLGGNIWTFSQKSSTFTQFYFYRVIFNVSRLDFKTWLCYKNLKYPKTYISFLQKKSYFQPGYHISAPCHSYMLTNFWGWPTLPAIQQVKFNHFTSLENFTRMRYPVAL